jgi:NAD(P)H-flavin reductase
MNGWKYSTGRVSEQMIRERLPAPSAAGDTLAVICGPRGFVQECCRPKLAQVGFKEQDVYVF